MKTLTDAKEIEVTYKGCTVSDVGNKHDDSVDIYFSNNSYIRIQGEAINNLTINKKLELERIRWKTPNSNSSQDSQ